MMGIDRGFRVKIEGVDSRRCYSRALDLVTCAVETRILKRLGINAEMVSDTKQVRADLESGRARGPVPLHAQWMIKVISLQEPKPQGG